MCVMLMMMMMVYLVTSTTAFDELPDTFKFIDHSYTGYVSPLVLVVGIKANHLL